MPGRALDDRERERALARYEVLRAHLQDGVSLARVAARAGVSLRTVERWLACYRRDGLAGLARAVRSDRGSHQLPDELVMLVQGLALRRPAPAVVDVYRQAVQAASARGLPAPSYRVVRAIVSGLDRGMVTLAHEGSAAYRDRFELCCRREAEASNACWQADHTLLDLLICDARGRPARPWLTVIEDDHSRAVAGYALNLGAPSALQTALALRQAIWPKQRPGWPLCGIPEMLYADHGSDFTSRHLEQVCADLHICLVHSTAGVPQGRGKLERLFGTITTELLPGLPGYLPPRSGRPATPPALSMAQLDDALGHFIVDEYNQRAHSETKAVPVDRWTAGGWLPRMPESLEQLDLLLLTVARPRVVHRVGIRFEGQRYLDLTLAGYVGEPVTIRYDPRDLAEIRVYHRDAFLCRAVSPELAGQTISLKDLQAARTARRRALRAQLTDRRKLAGKLVPGTPYPDQNVVALPLPSVPPAPAPASAPRRRLRLYRED